MPHNFIRRNFPTIVGFLTMAAVGVLIVFSLLQIRDELRFQNEKPSPTPTVISDPAQSGTSGGGSGGAGATGTSSRPAQTNGSASGSAPQNNQATGQNPQNPGLTDPTTEVVCDAAGVCVSL